MSNLKVLKLDWWMLPHKHPRLEEERQYCFSKCKALTPVINRPGRYRLGKQCWFEVDGRAYEDDMFEYDLALLDAERYNDRQVQALKSVVSQGLASKEQKKLLALCLEVICLRRISRETGASFLKRRLTQAKLRGIIIVGREERLRR